MNDAADQIYAGLQRARDDLGLGEFDNSVPEFVTGYRENLEDLQEIRDFVVQAEASL